MRFKLTVILGNYNKACFLPKTLDALLAQTRPADELILVDDASTDDSVAILSSYVSRHPNCRLVVNDTNQGANRNVNRLSAEAQGDVLFFAPSDDLVYPHFFEHGMELLEAHPQAALFSARSDMIDAEGRNLGVFHIPLVSPVPTYIDPATCARLLMRDDSWFMGNVTLFRRDRLHEVGGFLPDLSSVADSFASRYMALKHGVCFSPESLGAWRMTRSGISWRESYDPEAVARTVKACEEQMIRCGAFPPSYPQRWRRRYLFAAKRLRLSHHRAAAAERGLVSYGCALFQEAAGVAWSFMTLRPWDLWSVASRRIAQLLNIRR